jgi:protein tyrosine phosphatase (PTP) superfamily phosphohydrolase (DUF442 family)
VSSFGRRRAVAVALSAALAGFAAGARAQEPAPPPPLANLHAPLPGVFTGGAPASLDGYPAVAALGIRTYVELRGDSEIPEGTREAVEAAGMKYVRLTVAGEADLDLASARALDALLDDPDNLPAAIACSSGNRSGALLAVEGFWLDGRPAQEALALGLDAGLTRLEPSVRLLLGLPPLPPAPPAAPATPPN